MKTARDNVLTTKEYQKKCRKLRGIVRKKVIICRDSSELITLASFLNMYEFNVSKKLLRKASIEIIDDYVLIVYFNMGKKHFTLRKGINSNRHKHIILADDFMNEMNTSFINLRRRSPVKEYRESYLSIGNTDEVISDVILKEDVEYLLKGKFMLYNRNIGKFIIEEENNIHAVFLRSENDHNLFSVCFNNTEVLGYLIGDFNTSTIEHIKDKYQEKINEPGHS